MNTLILKDKTLLADKAYINGNWVAGDDSTDVYNPATGKVIAKVANINADKVKGVVDAAYTAQKLWAAKTAKERCTILLKWQQLMLDNTEDLAQILTAEMGKPITEARGEIAYGASFVQWFAEEGRRIYGDTIPGHQSDKRILVLKQPVGVVAAITPWNFPNAMIARKVAPALAAGCSFIVRPAEITPLSALAMAVLADRAGIPAGVFNVITSSNSAAIGQEFCANNKIRKISFTGSNRVGSILMQQCAGDVKKLSLELGGNAPFIVFDDADIDKAIEGVLIAKFRNSGQTCVCANRIYAQAPIYAEFVKKLSIAVANLKVGNGVNDDAQIGPVIDKNGLAKVQEHLDDALAKGAKVETGGAINAAGELFFNPTVLSAVNDNMIIAHEETFGPIAPVFKFDTEEEVIAMANNTQSGLASYFYAQNLSRVWRVQEALEYGMVGVNTGLISTAEAPFGGIKESGLGREGSKYGIEDYLEIKYICTSI